MSAIDYANSQDWLAYLNGKKKTQDKIPTTNVFGGFPFSAPSFAAGGKMKRKKRGKMAENRLIEEPGMPLFAYGGSLKTVSTPTVEPVGVFDNGKDTLFALGGVLQSHGSDWGNGATHIDAGQSHEENPNDGVQIGVDQNGVPNLVEEGEVVFNDYVYSKRIYLDEEAKKAFHISKNRDITYADMAKKLEKESEERPNDPISAAALKAQMQDLADQQERQKQEMEAERAEEAFNALSDEEKVALMQQAAEQEQMAQEQAMAEEQAMQQPSPEEMAAMEQQAAIGQQMSPEEAAMMQQQMAAQEGTPMGEPVPEGYAYGGELGRDENLFGYGGLEEQLKAAAEAEKRGQTVNQNKETKTKDTRSADFANIEYQNNFEWLAKNHPEFSNDTRAKLAELMARAGGGSPSSNYSKLVPTVIRTKEHKKKFFDRLIAGGLSKEDAYKVVQDGRKSALNPAQSALEDWYYLTGRQPQASTSTGGNEQKAGWFETSSGIKTFTTKGGKTKYYADGTAYDTENEALKAAASNSTESGIPSGYSAPLSEYRTENGRRIVYPYKEVKYPTAKAANEAAGRIIYAGDSKEAEKKAPVSTRGSETGSGTAAAASAQSAAVVDNTGNIIGYDWYRNGFDGIGEPRGFTVGKDGQIDKKTGYTDQYRTVVDSLTADDIRKWATERGWTPNDYSKVTDPSLLSFLQKGNKLEDLTTEQWKAGAQDGKYGFMHHVASDFLRGSQEVPQDVNGTASAVSATAPKPFEEEYSMIARPAVQSLAAQYGAPWAPENASTGTDAGKAGTAPVTTTDGRKIVPVTSKLDNLRYAGLFGPAVGLGLWAAGVGKPDTSGLDAAVANAARAYHTASNKYLGNYMRYRPLDTWFTQAKIDAQARATDRAIRNSGVNQGSMIAGFLQNGLNSQLASGEALRADNKYNREDEFKTGEFNRGTDTFNAQAYNQLSQFNADALNRGRQFGASLAMQGAAQKMAADAGWYNSLYGNINGLFKGMSDLGREVSDKNWIARLAASGAIPGIVPENAINAGLVKYADTSAEGGKIRKKKGKKKGLTI